MAGLYFHIPFCKRICSYCDFFRVARLEMLGDAVGAMHSEMEEQVNFLTDKRIKTIYFGGGTPSLLRPSEFQRFIDHAAQLWDLSQVDEITVEANPDDITQEWVSELRSTQVNRVSLGIQSLNDAELKFMNRRHSSAQAVEAVRRLQMAGISNITIDLIFGVDGFGLDVLAGGVDEVLKLGVQHISAYHLTIEPGTAFGRRLVRGEMCEVDESVSEAEFGFLHEKLTSAGYEHYEVSNYAREGYRAKHNASYWHGDEYLGIGAGAHSFNGVERHYVEQDIADYIKGREWVVEKLDERDRLNEYVMTSLRCVEGLNLDFIAEKFGVEESERVVRVAQSWADGGNVIIDGRWVRIPAERFMISDAVIESMFEV